MSLNKSLMELGPSGSVMAWATCTVMYGWKSVYEFSYIGTCNYVSAMSITMNLYNLRTVGFDYCIPALYIYEAALHLVHLVHCVFIDLILMISPE